MSKDIKGNSEGPIGLGIYGSLQGQPPVETLLSLRLLKDANKEAFEDLAREETKFLSASLALVKNDPLLRLKMGGDVLTSSLNLAKQLKVHAEDKLFKDRIEAMIDGLNTAELRAISDELVPRHDEAKFVNMNQANDPAQYFTVADAKATLETRRNQGQAVLENTGNLYVNTKGTRARFGWQMPAP